MIVVHIESGLGNQMLSYCEYLSLRYANPQQEFYLETIIYEIPECNEYICQWNGYELDRIFGIENPKNIKTLFSKEEWQQIINEIKQTEFWKHNWNYPVAFTEVLMRHGLPLENERGNFDPNHNLKGTGYQRQASWMDKMRKTSLYMRLYRRYQLWNEHRLLQSVNNQEKTFCRYNQDVFTGQWLSLKNRNNGRELIDEDILKSFTWPAYTREKDIEMAKYLRECNSVAIHARRGDALSGLAWCYNNGYFRRAVRHIRKNVSNPSFVFFTNTGSVDWCMDNLQIFGLNADKDNIRFVDWNKGEDSYRDMQLMGECKHAIITPSSFGWWGAYFIRGEKKITISPLLQMDTTYHC